MRKPTWEALDTFVTRVMLVLPWLMSPWSTTTVDARTRPAISCVDGAEVPGTVETFACDRDGIPNGQCVFEAAVRHRGSIVQRQFKVSARSSRSVRVRGPGLRGRARFRLQCIAADAERVQTIACTDGVLAATDGGGSAGVCDFDRACDGVCSFAFSCPLCSYGEPRCLLPCSACPELVNAVVPVGGMIGIRLPQLGKVLLMRCAAPPAGTPCRAVTTTTTIPPDCVVDEDCLRFPEPCRTCIDGWCTEPVPPGGGFVSCPVPLVTTTTIAPSHCRGDDDCNLEASVAGCTPVAGCGFCTDQSP